mgnify:CR=1 FL=1
MCDKGGGGGLRRIEFELSLLALCVRGGGERGGNERCGNILINLDRHGVLVCMCVRGEEEVVKSDF